MSNDEFTTCGGSDGNKTEHVHESAPENENTEELTLFSDETTSSNIANDQEESSMWQKCPVITFQTFDDLTGWLKSRLLAVSDCVTNIIVNYAGMLGIFNLLKIYIS